MNKDGQFIPNSLPKAMARFQLFAIFGFVFGVLSFVLKKQEVLLLSSVFKILFLVCWAMAAFFFLKGLAERKRK